MDEQGPPTVPGGPSGPSLPAPVDPSSEPTEPLVRSTQPGYVPPRPPVRDDRNKLLLIVAGLVALALIGILALRSGDDDKDAKPNDQGTSVPSEPTAKTRFIEEAEALCAKNSAKMAKLKQPVNPADATIYYARTGEALRKLVKKIKGLDIPSADKPILDKLFKTLDKLVATIDQLTVESVRSGELATQALNRKVGKINIRANALAQEYGLNGCVQG